MGQFEVLIIQSTLHVKSIDSYDGISDLRMSK